MAPSAPQAAGRASQCYLGIDALTWIDLNTPILFGLPLILAGLSGSQRLLWILTALLMGTAFVVYVLQRPPGPFADDPWFVNRVMVEAQIAVTAIITRIACSNLTDRILIISTYLRGGATNAGPEIGAIHAWNGTLV